MLNDNYPAAHKLEYDEKEYWKTERKKSNIKKLAHHEISHITFFLSKLRREILWIKFLKEEQAAQNIRLINEGLAILKEHGINLPNWPKDYEEI